MRILVTGASGSIGAALAPALVRAGHDVRGFSRDPARVSAADIPVVRGDAVTGAGLDAALAGIDVAYFLIHSMEGSARAGFEARERAAARHFVAAAQDAGVRRVVYLGGLAPTRRPPSRHLRSRLEVERILLAGVPEALALRASIVVGAQSRSFRFLVHLVERMKVALPPWREHRTRPIDVRDVVAYLVAGATAPHGAGGPSLDIAGPDVLSYGAMIERIADLMLVRRPALRLGRDATPLVAPFAAAVAGEDPGFVAPLMESLGGDLLPRDERAPALLGVRLHRFDRAVERALRDWEAAEPLAAR